MIELQGIHKRFGSIVAVDDVSLRVAPGEVVALLGENGAGKSTLMKILYGVCRPDAGVVRVDGHPLPLGSSRAARRAGIGMVFQQFSLIPALSVRENLMLAYPRAPRWLPPHARAWRDVCEVLQTLLPDLSPRMRAGELTVGQKQLLELAKLLNMGARTLIFDEPTSVLARPEAELLWGHIRRVASAGAAVVLITHKLEDVEACADRVAVLRAGRLVGETRAVNDRTTLLGWALGGAPLPAPAPRGEIGAPRLVVRGATARVDSQRVAIDHLDVGRGELLGVAGVTGNGQEVLARLLAGVVRAERGRVELDGEAPAARADEIGFVPEQPLHNGVAADLSVLANVVAPRVRRLSLVPRWTAERTRALRLLSEADVRPLRLDMPAGALSGGNLQKLVVARELDGQPRLVVACYPTMGLDAGAASAVLDRLRAAAAGGAAVVWISEDLERLFERADRIAVLHAGVLHPPLPAQQVTRQRLGALMTGAAA